MKKLALLLILFLCSAAMPASSAPLIEVTKSTNRNVVHYDLEATGIRVYWKMHESDGHVEELTAFERERVYGVDVDESESLRFSIRAFPSLVFTVRDDRRGQPQATLPIDGQERVIRSAHLTLSGFLVPRVVGIELRGDGGFVHPLRLE